MVTINPATLLRLDWRLGGIAVGRRADLLLLPDLVSFRPETVIAGGQVAARECKPLTPLHTIDWDDYGSRPRFSKSLQLAEPGLYPLRASGAEAEVTAIHLESAVITSRKDVTVRVKGGLLDPGPGLLHAALVEREGAWISRALISGFADNLEGLASTYNTTTHLLVLGRRPEAMAQASQRVREIGGGIAVVQEGKIVYELPLPITGMMSELSFEEVARRNDQLSRVVANGGYEFHDILYTLLFMTCDFLPTLRLTPLGLLDVKTSRVVAPAEEFVAPEPD
jgi:adenine deaminase